MGEVVSVNVGSAKQTEHSTVGQTAIDKQPVSSIAVSAPGPARGTSGVRDDDICDADHHGGDDQAVYAYAAESYDFWQPQVTTTLRPGCFGENVTTKGIDVDNALIGERWRVGDVLLEVSTPRIPCRTFAGWMCEPDWVRRFNNACKPGAYLRVIEPGTITPGAPIEIEFRPDHDITIALTFRAKTQERHLLPYVATAPAAPERLKAKGLAYAHRHK